MRTTISGFILILSWVIGACAADVGGGGEQGLQRLSNRSFDASFDPCAAGSENGTASGSCSVQRSCSQSVEAGWSCRLTVDSDREEVLAQFATESSQIQICKKLHSISQTPKEAECEFVINGETHSVQISTDTEIPLDQTVLGSGTGEQWCEKTFVNCAPPTKTDGGDYVALIQVTERNLGLGISDADYIKICRTRLNEISAVAFKATCQLQIGDSQPVTFGAVEFKAP